MFRFLLHRKSHVPKCHGGAFANDCVAPPCHEVIEPCSVFHGIAIGNVPVSSPLAEGISRTHGMLPGELLAKVPVRRGFC